MLKKYIGIFVFSVLVIGALIFGFVELANPTQIRENRPSTDSVISSPTSAPVSKIVIDDKFSTPPTCRTLGGLMVVKNGKGEIGCDVVVNGDFDLSRSYCQGQKTLKTQNLTPDLYGRPSQYYATLKGLDPSEEVRVFIYSMSGKMIECSPVLNGVWLE